MNREKALGAVKQDGMALKGLGQGHQGDPFVVSTAVRQNGKALQFASSTCRASRKIVKAAVMQDPTAITFADTMLQEDAAFVLDLVATVDSYTSEHAAVSPVLLRSRPFVLKAVSHKSKFGSIFAKSSFTGDREVALLAVRKDGDRLSGCSSELRSDKEVVLAAIGSSLSALQYADKRLRSDRQVAMASIKRWGQTLQYADEVLRNDRELVLVAMANTGPFDEPYPYVGESLKNDPEVLRLKRKGESASCGRLVLQLAVAVLCLLFVLTPIVSIALLGSAPLIADRFDRDGKQLCSSLNGSCVGFFDSCLDEWELTTSSPMDRLCPVSMKCCTANQPMLSSCKRSGNNVFVAPPPKSFFGNLQETEYEELEYGCCGKLLGSIVPAGASWIGLQGFVGTVIGVLLNIINNTDSVTRMSTRLTATFRVWRRKLRMCLSPPQQRGEHGLLDSDRMLSRDGLSACDDTEKIFLRYVEDHEFERETLKHFPFAERCFLMTTLLGLKSVVSLVIGFAYAVHRTASVKQGGWDAYNVFAALLFNSSVSKAVVDVSTLFIMSFIGQVEKWDGYLLDDSGFSSNAGTFLSFFLEFGGIFCVMPLAMFGLGMKFLKILIVDKKGQEIPDEEIPQVGEGSRRRRLPTPVVYFSMVYGILVLPAMLTHFIVGTLIFLPALFCFLAPAAFIVYAVVYICSIATVRWRVERAPDGYTGDTLYHHSQYRYCPTRFATVFQFLRIAVGVVFANILSSYFVSLPVNWMALVYTEGSDAVHGSNYLQLPFVESALRSQTCFYLQFYSSFLASLDSIVRLC